MTKEWFAVDRKGLRNLQLGKPKHYVIRELIQNAFDEPITTCKVTTGFDDNMVELLVEDDSPIGFRDMTDAFTLYKDTYKRREPEKRGRFNVGEKQAFAICEYAQIRTTKGTIIFDKTGRHTSSSKTSRGTSVKVRFKANKTEYGRILAVLENYIVPNKISFIVNGVEMPHQMPTMEISAQLLTEFEKDKVYRRSVRQTDIGIYHPDDDSKPRFLCEMGIPVQKIDCLFTLDVQQKIPMSVDRDSVSLAYLQDLYAVVLNCTYPAIPADKCSENWIRLGASDEKASREAVKAILQKRYGDKVVVANPFDKISIDNAIANGYRVVTGQEMSKNEWGVVKGFGLMASSTDLFGQTLESAPPVKPNENQLKFADFAQRFAKRILNIDIKVAFFLGGEGMVRMQYGNRTLSVNVSKCNPMFASGEVSAHMIDDIDHELGHEFGLHTEVAYHSALSRIAGASTILALEEPEFFNLRVPETILK